jgi:hypothetical protein
MIPLNGDGVFDGLLMIPLIGDGFFEGSVKGTGALGTS